MRTAHERSCESWLASCALLAACASDPLPDSMWPPADFELRVEQIRLDDGSPQIAKRFRALADGVVSFATASTSVVDLATGTRLPVFDRVAAYRLVPTSIRALARRIHRAGVLDLDTRQGERGVSAANWLVVHWQAFDRTTALTATGRVHGPMADILSIVMAHLPDGESFDVPGLSDRPVVPVLRGVPAPLGDGVAALEAHVRLLQEHPADRTLLEDAFALACATGDRAQAERLLDQWADATAAARQAAEMFPDGPPQLTPDILRRLLPAGG